jgi:homoserine dehydrogenase
MKGVYVGLIGFGTVGSGVVKILEQNGRLIEKRLGIPVILKRIVDLDLETDRGVAIDPSKLTCQAEDVIEDPQISIMIELIGGFEPAKRFILEALRNRKHVVTANKALLAIHGDEIFQTAHQHGVDINFEASVGGGIPIIRSMREGLGANRILSFFGILNGTSNYILTRMEARGETFEQVLREAQREGYAEADPSMDIEGIDPAHKLSILISLAWGARVRFEDIPRGGISAISPLDIQCASESGYKIKLVAVARDEDAQIEAQVHPLLIPLEHPLAAVDGVNNAIFVTGDAVGSTMYYGQGAGQMPTASAVVSDVMEVARNVRDRTRGRLSPYSCQRRYVKKIRIKDIGHVDSRWYLRLSVVEGPHVLSRIAGILEKHDVGMMTLHKRAREADGTVPVVILTGMARGRNMIRALRKIDQLPVISGNTMAIRIEDRFS